MLRGTKKKLKPALCVITPPFCLQMQAGAVENTLIPRIGCEMEVPCKEETHTLHVKHPWYILS